MSEVTNEQPGEIFDFASLGALDNASIEKKILPANLYKFQVSSAKVVPGKKDPASRNLMLELTLVDPVTLTDGRVINAGYKVSHWIGLIPTDKRSGEDIASDLALLQVTFLGTKGGTFNPEVLVGQEGIVKLKVEHDDTFGDSNRIAKFVPKSA